MQSQNKQEAKQQQYHNRFTSLSPPPPSGNDTYRSSPAKEGTPKPNYQINSPEENKALLKQKECQNWLRKRYRVRANVNYLWHAHQLYDKKQLDDLFNTLVDNSPKAYQFEMKQDELKGEEQQISLKAFYNLIVLMNLYFAK